MAARLSACPPPPAAAGAGVEDVAGLELDGVGALVDVEAEELVLLELPHPVRARTPMAKASIEAVERERTLS